MLLGIGHLLLLWQQVWCLCEAYKMYIAFLSLNPAAYMKIQGRD